MSMLAFIREVRDTFRKQWNEREEDERTGLCWASYSVRTELTQKEPAMVTYYMRLERNFDYNVRQYAELQGRDVCAPAFYWEMDDAGFEARMACLDYLEEKKKAK